MQFTALMAHPSWSARIRQWLKGSGFKKGVCAQHFMPWVSHPWAPLAWPSFLEGLSLPSLVPSPLSGLKVHLPLFLPAMGNCRWSGLGSHSDNNASPSVEHVSPLWPDIQWTLLSCLWCHPGPHHWCLPPCVPSTWRELWPADCPWASTKERI